MRKLKLQMNIALDNKWDSGMSEFSLDNLANVDCVLHGRKTAEEFIPYWNEVANNPNDGEHKLGKRFAEIPNAVFSNTIKESKWKNTEIINGGLTEAIPALKGKVGKDIIVYGGNSFALSLMTHGLADELYLLVNPASIGNGQSTFNPLSNNSQLKLVKCKPFECDVVLLLYARRN